MKRSNKKSVAMFFGAVFLFPLSALADLNTGLIAHWSFDDCTAKDNKNKLNGILHGNPSCVSGKIGKALSFNSSGGQGDYVVLPTINTIFQSGVSSCAWVQFTENRYWERIIDLGNGDGIDNILFARAGTSNDLALHSFNNNHNYIGTLSKYGIRNNIWKHYCFTQDVTSSTAKLYIDSNLIASSNAFIITNVSRNRNFIAHSNFPYYSYGDMDFKGLMDEVRLYNRALTASEIAELYTSGLPTPSLHATALSPYIMRLSWNDNASGEKGFRIQRKLGNCSSTNAWTTVLDVSANTTSAWDKTVTANTAYSYQIATYYGGQSFSPYSACVSATTPAAGTPQTPTEIIAKSKSNSRIDLTWKDESSDEASFLIQRQTNGGSWISLKTVPANSQTYSDTSAIGNKTTTNYAYTVKACTSTRCSAWNPNVAIVPLSPSNLAASIGTTVKLTWTDNSPNDTGFHVHRKNGDCSAATPWTAIAGLATNTTSYSDSSAISGSVYSYLVNAHNYQTASQPYSYGYSGYTNCVSATAP